jgi:hypothetical protein
MPKRRRGNRLERWEVAMVKAMLHAGGHNDQDILAYFTRPTRTVNHRLIGQVRKETVHKAVKAASPGELSDFLTAWPDTDPLTGLSLRGGMVIWLTIHAARRVAKLCPPSVL